MRAITALASSHLLTAIRVVKKQRSDAPLLKVMIPEGMYEGAKCMDGTPYGFYYRAGGTGSTDSTTWVMHVHGGGSCDGFTSCKDWYNKDVGSMGIKGSSSGWAPEKNDGPGALMSDPSKNPVFHDAHHIWVPYCTADGHGGQVSTLAGPVGTKDSVNAPWGNYYFDGHLNIKAMFKHVHATFPEFANMEKLLLQGNSAGGIGVFKNCDWAGNFVRENVGSNVQVKCNPSAGWFVPGYAEDNTDHMAALTPYDLWSTGGVRPPYSLSDPDPSAPIKPYYPENCLASLHDKPAHACGSATQVYPTIQQPVFVAQDMFDYAMTGSLGLKNDKVGTCIGNDYLSYVGKSMVNTTTKLMSEKPGDGIFLVSCWGHGVADSATIQGITELQALSAWFNQDGSVPNMLVDDCQTASDTWLPCGQGDGCTHIAPCDPNGGPQEPGDDCLNAVHELCFGTYGEECVACVQSEAQNLGKAGCTAEHKPDIQAICAR